MQYFLCINSEKLGIWNETRTLQPKKQQDFDCFFAFLQACCFLLRFLAGAHSLRSNHSESYPKIYENEVLRKSTL